MPISKDANAKKDPEAVFQAIAETLEVSTSYWNHIDEMYSDIKQGDDESIDKLDQRIKNLVEECQHTEAEKLVCRTELLFHATKHFEVKKWVQSKTRREDVMYAALLQYAKEHEMTWKILTAISPMEESPNWWLSMQLKVSNVVRRAVEMAAQMEQAVHTEVAPIHIAPIKCVVNVTWHTHTRIAQHMAKSAINAVTKIISVHVAGQIWAETKDAREIEHKLMAGVQRDITNPVEADAPDPGPDHGHDQAVNQWHIMLTASKLTDMT